MEELKLAYNIPLPKECIKYMENQLSKFDGEMVITTELKVGGKEVASLKTIIEPEIYCPKCNTASISSLNQNLSKCMKCGEEILTRRNSK